MEEMDLLGTFDSTWMGGALSMPAADSIQVDEQSIREFICPVASIPSDEAAGQLSQLNKRRNSSPDVVKDTVGRDGKRIKSLDKGGVSGPIMLYDVHQLQHINQDTQSLLFSCPPKGAPSVNLLDSSGNRHGVPQIRLFKLDRTKHKIFLSHSGAQKGFVEQLCVDLEARGYFFPFLDQRHHSLPKGKDFVPLIKEAAQLCHVAVMVLSNEFLCSKWPMIELAEFHAAQQAENHHLNMLPLFYKLSVDDLDDKAIQNRWMPIWIQHASKDERIDVTKWSAAVTALRRANGLIFCKNAMSKVTYRKDVVRHISRLSPPDLLNDSSRDMVGYGRICQIVTSRFVQDTTVGASVLGLYGTSGLGKSTLCKALCDYFPGHFSGRVCHVELGETFRMARVSRSEGLGEAYRMKRQNLMLQKLCGFEKDLLGRITDIGQGLKQMREYMKREPVFLAIDNVTNDESSRKEAHEYLTVGFHAESRIMITSRSEIIVQDLLPGVEFCMPVPSLSVNEAGSIFLRSAAPMKSIFMLTDEEQRIVGLCIEQCLFESDQDESGSNSGQDELRFLTADHLLSLRRNSYHPLALSALGDFFYRFSGNTHILHWKDHLERNKHLVKDVWRCPTIMSVISLQFNSLHPSEQLLFLDIALFTEDLVEWHQLSYHLWIEWLSRLHEETPTVMERKLRDLKRSGLIDWCEETEEDEGFYVYVHALYKEFAEWYVTEHEVRGLKNAWGVFQASGSSLRCDPSASKHWSDLVRLRIFDSTRASARFVASKTMQELHNLVLLQLYLCTDLMLLNLDGLNNLRHLELVKLSKLVAITFGGSSSTDENVGMVDSLQNVLFTDLESLTNVPDFRACTALYSFYLSNCPKMTNFEAIECPHMKELVLIWLVQHQYGKLPNFKSLHSLVFLHIGAHSDVDMFVAEWEKPFLAMDAQLSHQDPSVHFGMPSFILLEELVLHIRQCNHLRFKQAHHYLQPWKECCSTDE